MSKYHGYGRFLVHRTDDEFQKYELLHSEITQFGHTVPYRVKKANLRMKEKIDLIKMGLEIANEGKRIEPNEWLDEHVANSMPYELENMIDGYDFEVDLDGYAEICGFLRVEDTSSDGPDGYEYDSELHLEKPEFTKFTLEDLKESSYSARDIAYWIVGDNEEEIEKLYTKLVGEGYGKTEDHLILDQEEEDFKYKEMMETP